MKSILPVVAIEVFECMIGRAATQGEQLALRQLHDAYSGSDSRAAWWDTVHKYKLECLIGNGFDWLQERVSADLKTIRAKDATLASLVDLQKAIDNAAVYTLTLSCVCFVVGVLVGVLFHAIAVR